MLATDPIAAPTTVPAAPKNAPSTAAVAAAPAPAITLLTESSILGGELGGEVVWDMAPLGR